MARRKSKNDSQKINQNIQTKAKPFIWRYLLALILGVVLTASCFIVFQNKTSKQINNSAALLMDSGSLQLTQISDSQAGKRSVMELLALSDEELEKVDIALMNLICAKGLNGSEDLDINKCLLTLDEWAEFIKKDTETRLPSYFNNPKKYDNSINLFKAVTMILCLKNNLGVDYNLDIMKREVFPDSKDVFIHGCLTNDKQGGCVSIPTLCVAIGRRLGYPLKLVCAKKHVFF